MIRKKRWLRLAAVGMAFGLLAAACGDDEGTETGQTGATEATDTGTDATDATETTDEEPVDTGPPYVLDKTGCPPDVDTPLPAGAPIKLGWSAPQTGALAAFGIIGQGLQAYVNKVNAEEGGVDGHQIELVIKDDAYAPDKTKTNVEQFIGSDKVFAGVFTVGTPNVGAVRQLFEDACVPQLWVGTGFPAWGDPKNFQFTTGGLLAYNTEAQLWAEWIKAKYPDGAKVAQLVFNNDFGKAYQAAFEKVVQGTNIEVAETAIHEPTSTLNNEITSLLTAAPDVILGETTSTFCTELMKQARQGGFEGEIMLSATCASVSQFWTPAGEAAEEGYILGAQKDPSDPQYKDDPAMKQYFADMAKYNASAKPEIGSVATGYNVMSLIVDNLKDAAGLEGGLTRANLMTAAWNTNTTLPLSLEGAKAIVNGNTDAYIAETTEVLKWDPDKQGLFATGEKFDREGETGLFK